jgi:paraquat-inducible protein A
MSPVILCPSCDLVHRGTKAPEQGRTQCARCRAPLQRAQGAALDTAIALAACALVLLFLSNAYPLVEMHVNGSTRETTLIGAALGLHAQNFDTLAALVLLTTVIAPLLQITALLYLLLPLRRQRHARGQQTVFRLLTRIRQWSFTEVFLLGVLAALVRLSTYTYLVTGISLWSCVLLMLCLSALASITSPEQIWRWIERVRP